MLGKVKNRETFEKSTMLFMRALELDPNYSQAYASLGFAYTFDYQNRWSDDPDRSLRLAKRNSRTGDRKGPQRTASAMCGGVGCNIRKRPRSGKGCYRRCAIPQPEFGFAYTILGNIHNLSGQPLEAIPLIERAMRLDPAFGAQYLHFLGMAYLLARKYETAAAVLRQRIVLAPETDFSRAALASALGHLGEVDEAGRIWRELQEINPKYSFTEHFGRQPFRQEDVERIAEGLAKAGLLNEQIVTLAH